jgi:hypothetical protein
LKTYTGWSHFMRYLFVRFRFCATWKFTSFFKFKFMRSHRFEIYVHFILSFKIVFNAWGWSLWPKHVAWIQFFVVEGNFSFNVVALSKNYKNQFHILTVFFTDFITFLLQKIGTYVDPRILVKRIESGLEIPGLKHSLVKMMQDYNLQVYEVSLMSNSQTDVCGQFVNGTVLHCYRPVCHVIISHTTLFSHSLTLSWFTDLSLMDMNSLVVHVYFMASIWDLCAILHMLTSV